MSSSLPVQDLLELMRSTRSQDRVQAADSLGRLKDSSALPALIQALDDTALTIRLASIVALGRIGDINSAPFLIKLFDDSSALARGAAAITLASLGDPASVEPLEHAAQTEQNPEVRERMTSALDNLRSTIARVGGSSRGSRDVDEVQSVDAAIRQLGNPDLAKRASAVEFLGRSQNPEALEPLIKSLNFTDATLRIAAIIALGKIGGKEIPRVIESKLGDPVSLVRVAASHTLGILESAGSRRALNLALNSELEPQVRRHISAALTKLPEPQVSDSRPTSEMRQADERLRDTTAEIRPQSTGPEISRTATGRQSETKEGLADHVGEDSRDAQAPTPVPEMNLVIRGVETDGLMTINQWDLIRVIVENKGSTPVWVTSLEVMGPADIQASKMPVKIPESSAGRVEFAAKPIESGRSLPLMVSITYRNEAGAVDQVSDLQFLTVDNPETAVRKENNIIVSGDYLAAGASKVRGDVFSPRITRREQASTPMHPKDHCPTKNQELPPDCEFCIYCGQPTGEQ